MNKLKHILLTLMLIVCLPISAQTISGFKRVSVSVMPNDDTVLKSVGLNTSNELVWFTKLPQVNSDWNATSGPSQILNKPVIPASVVHTSQQVSANDNATNDIKYIKYSRVYATEQNQAISLTGTHNIGIEYYVKNPTAFTVELIGQGENINGNQRLIMPPNSYWHLIKEDNGTNSITAFNITINAVDSTPRIAVSEKAQANGVATLGSDGKVPNSQIPALAISETFPVSSQAQMLALSQADQGDVAIRSDISKSFILRVSPSSVLANWSELLTPTGAVTSVAGKVGVVTLNTSDIGGLQTALNLKANDSDVVKLTGNQTISGQKSFSLTGKIDMQTNNASPAIIATAIGSNGNAAAMFINNSSSPYSSALNLQTGLSGGVGNRALYVSNQSSIGTGIYSDASNGGVSISSQSGNGDSYVSNITSGGTGRNYVGRNNGTETYSVDKTGNVIGNSYIKMSTPANNILLAGGGDLAQGTAFNKNFGTTAGTVVEGGTLGSNAYSSTAYLPIMDGYRTSFDFNSKLTSGLYNSADGSSNLPSTAGGYGQLISARGADTGFQMYGGWNQDNMWFRGWSGNGSDFTPWRKVWHDGNDGVFPKLANVNLFTNKMRISGGGVSTSISDVNTTATHIVDVANTAISLATGYVGSDNVFLQAFNNSSNTPKPLILNPFGGDVVLGGNLSAPNYTGDATLTGTPTAPTAPVGTNTTQIATTAFVDGLDSGNVKLTGTQTITGRKIFNNSTAGAAVVTNNTSTGTGLSTVNSSAGTGIYSNNQSTGKGIHSDNNSTGISIYSLNYQSGNGIVSNQGASGTGFNYVGQNNGTNTFTVNKLGATTATSFINSTAPATNALLANGTTVALGSNAYTSTAYLPLTGGTLSGAISGTSANFTSSVTASAHVTTGGTSSQYVKGDGSLSSAAPDSRPYKVYTALLTQSGTNAPVATVLENTLGGTVAWSRNAPGIYYATLAGSFTINKTFVSSSNRYIGFTPIYRLDSNIISLATSVTGSTYVDNVLENNSIEIRVYN